MSRPGWCTVSGGPTGSTGRCGSGWWPAEPDGHAGHDGVKRGDGDHPEDRFRPDDREPLDGQAVQGHTVLRIDPKPDAAGHLVGDLEVGGRAEARGEPPEEDGGAATEHADQKEAVHLDRPLAETAAQDDEQELPERAVVDMAQGPAEGRPKCHELDEDDPVVAEPRVPGEQGLIDQRALQREQQVIEDPTGMREEDHDGDGEQAPGHGLAAPGEAIDRPEQADDEGPIRYMPRYSLQRTTRSARWAIRRLAAKRTAMTATLRRSAACRRTEDPPG